ncbi:DUF2993 domain-containing protein [Streptomyces sp. NPDC007088]|uniref:LmeA family phospholipid-binding protein n=1 Tax=Streptomyces sp. NPDC007088 TaxID=3364773 RepID=UPI0036945F61
MRALRILLVVVLVLGGLFVAADRIAVHYAQNRAADELRSREGLSDTPEVDIHGFPFLTQLAGGTLDEVGVRIKDYEADTGEGGGHLRVGSVDAELREVDFGGDWSSATARRATGTAVVGYPELLKAARAEPIELAPGIEAEVTALSDGGKGRVNLSVKAKILGHTLPKALVVPCSLGADGDRITVRAASLPDLGVPLAEREVRGVTDFAQTVKNLPAGIGLDSVRATPDGVRITLKGSNLRLDG